MNTINLNSGKSMFHNIETTPGTIEIEDVDPKKPKGAMKKIRVNVIKIITGLHEGNMEIGDTLICGPFSKYSTGFFEIVQLERRTHKGTGVRNGFFKAHVKQISKPVQ
jgi:hypothetical protein